MHGEYGNPRQGGIDGRIRRCGIDISSSGLGERDGSAADTALLAWEAGAEVGFLFAFTGTATPTARLYDVPGILSNALLPETGLWRAYARRRQCLWDSMLLFVARETLTSRASVSVLPHRMML